jgi:hypothetical protein
VTLQIELNEEQYAAAAAAANGQNNTPKPHDQFAKKNLCVLRVLCG